MTRTFRYDVALSFADEDRQYVEQVAQTLLKSGIKVFYDDFEKVSLWGKNLYDHLQKVYSEEALYTIIFVSHHYERKLWANHERQSAQARAFSQRQEYILPARFDDTQIPGLHQTTCYIDLQKFSPEQFAELIREKINTASAIPTQPIHLKARRIKLWEKRGAKLLAGIILAAIIILVIWWNLPSGHIESLDSTGSKPKENTKPTLTKEPLNQ